MATWTISSTFNVQVGTVTATDITVSYLAGADGADFTNDGTVDIYANTVRLNTSPSAPPGLQGEFSWNSDEETADLTLNGAVLQLGQEIHYHVRNNSGSEIADGKAVMATGTIGASGRITIGLMDGSSIANAKYFLGITTETIANGTDGKVTSLGKVRGIDTSAFTEGDVLWVDNDNVGELTSTMPTTKSKLPIAFVVTDHATQGVLAVRATDGTYFGEAHDLDLTSIAKGAIIGHNGTNFANLAVGSNDQVLTADSTQALGLKWADASGGGGEIINTYQTPYIDVSSLTNWCSRNEISLEYNYNSQVANTSSITTITVNNVLTECGPFYVADGNQNINSFNFSYTGNSQSSSIVKVSIVKVKWLTRTTISYITVIYEGAITFVNDRIAYFADTDLSNSTLSDGDFVYIFFHETTGANIGIGINMKSTKT